MSRYAQPMSQILAQMQEAKKITKKERDELEDDNQHGELALRLAQSFGTPQEVKKIKDINKRHMQKGSIDPKDQKERDAISNKYYKMAEEVEIDEMIPKSTMYALVKDGKVIAKGSKRDMMSKMKKEGGKVFNAPSKKVGDTIKEDGHDDVASAIRQCKTVTEDATQIQQKLQTMSPEDSLPTWWSNKLAIASNSMNKMRDYLLVPSVSEETELDEALKHTHMVLGPDGRVIGMSTNERDAEHLSKHNLLKVKGKVVKLKKPMSTTRGDRLIGMLPADNLGEALDKKDEPIVKKVVDMLKKASGAHAGQAKDLEKAIKEQPEHEIQVGDYTTKHFHMCGSAQKVMKKHADKDGAEELTKLQDKFYEIEMMAMNAGKPTDEQISQTKTLYNQIMSKAKEMGIDDEVGKYMKMHMDSMEKGDPKLGFGRTDKDDGKEPIDEKYDLYHSTFSGAMQHAYDYAKKKMGITVDPKEIDSKVATGPRKPTEGKTNTYRLKGKGGNLQIQVYNKGGSKPFELNMYKEEIEMNEKKKLKSGAKFDFQLFDDMKGAKEAEAELNKELHKAVRMKDKETAKKHMLKVQMKHSKFGATDTEPREVINMVLNAIFENKQIAEAKQRLEEAKISKELASMILSMNKNQKFVKASGDLVPEIYLSAADRDKLKAEFGKLPRGLPNATNGVTVVDMINYALGKDGVIDTEGGETSSPKLISWDRGGKVIGRPKTVGDAAKIAGVRMESVDLGEGYEGEVMKILDDAGIDGYFKMGKLYVSKRDAKDAKKALEDADNITKLPPMVKEEKMTKSLKDTIIGMWQESAKDKDEGNAFGAALQAAKEKVKIPLWLLVKSMM